METMHAAGRRRLPPVPRPAGDRSASGQVAVAVATDETDPDQFATQVIDTRQIAAELIEAELAALTEDAAEDAAEADDAVDDDAIEATQQLQLAELVALIYEKTRRRRRRDPGRGTERRPGRGRDVVIRGRGRTGGRGRGRGRGRPEPVAEAEAEVPELEPEVVAEAEAEVEVEPEPVAEAEVEVEPEPVAEVVVDDAPVAPEPPAETPVEAQDPAQQFVARLRSAAADFAGAAGAESAVVREAVPPARHRRARCRLVLRYADGALADVTLLGPAGSPGRPSRHGFDRQILRWLGAGLVQDDAWLVDDPDAPEGVAVDLTAWVAGA